MQTAEIKPEVIVTPEQNKGLRAIERSLEGILQPISHNSLTARLNTFASTFHFAFGSAADREVAIASWANVLADYPEWAIKQALEDVLVGYNPEKQRVLTPSIVIERVKYYLGDCYDLQGRVRRIFRDGKVFESLKEYTAWKAQEKEGDLEKQRNRQTTLSEINEQHEKLAKEISEQKEIAVKNKLIERARQVEELKKAARILKNEKRLDELYSEFKIILEQHEKDLNA